MKVFVTGAGLLGTHAAAALLDRGHAVTLFDLAPDEAYIRSIAGEVPALRTEAGDVTDLSTLAARLEGHDAVVHTAGLIGPRAQERPFVGFIVNVVGTVNVVEAARLAGATRFVYASTHGVYDFAASADQPMTESSPTEARAVYPATKLAAEQLLAAYARAYGLRVVALRFANLFGRGTFVAGSRGGAAFHELVTAPLRGEVAPILSPVAGRGEWLYAKDAAGAVAAAVEAADLEAFTVVNIGSGQLVGPDDLVAAVRAVIPTARFGAAAAPGRERGQPFDLGTARRILGWEPAFTLASAVADYVAETRAGRAAGSVGRPVAGRAIEPE